MMGCPICEKDDSIEHYYEQVNIFGKHWMECTRCKLWFTEAPTSSQLAEHYDSPKYLHNKKPSFLRRIGEDLRFRSQRKHIEQVVGKLSGSMLDYGCGDNRLILQYKDMDAFGVRWGEWSPVRKNDLITMSHSLEHLRNPVSGLTQIRECLLNDGGILFIEVPRMKYVQKRGFSGDHITNWTPASITLLLHKTGFTLLDLQDMWYPTQLGIIRCVARKDHQNAG